MRWVIIVCSGSYYPTYLWCRLDYLATPTFVTVKSLYNSSVLPWNFKIAELPSFSSALRMNGVTLQTDMLSEIILVSVFKVYLAGGQ